MIRTRFARFFFFISLIVFVGCAWESASVAMDVQKIWGPVPLANGKGLSSLSDVHAASDLKTGGWVAWRSSQFGVPKYFAGRFEPDGLLPGNTTGIPLFGGKDLETEVALAVGISQEAYVIVRSQTEEESHLRLQRMTAEGRLDFGKKGIRMSSATGEAYSFALDSSPRAVCAVWAEKQDGKFSIQYSLFLHGVARPELVPIILASMEAEPREIDVKTDGSGFFVAWTEKTKTSGWDIRAQYIGGNGETQWEGGHAVSQSPSDQRDFSTLVLEGDLFVAWSDYRNGNADIYGARIDSKGTDLWDANGSPLLLGPGRQQFPALYPADGRALWVVAQSLTEKTRKVAYQKVDFVGRALFGWLGKNTDFQQALWHHQSEGPVILGLPKVASAHIFPHGTGYWVVTDEESDSIHRVFFRRLSRDLHWRGKAITLGEGLGLVAQRSPRLAVFSNDDLALMWVDWYGGKPEVVLQRLGPDGRPLWRRPSHAGAYVLGTPLRMAAVEDGLFVLNGNRVYYFTENGQVTTPATGIQYIRTAPTDDNIQFLATRNAAVIVWSQNGNIGAQAITQRGVKLWGRYGVFVCTVPGDQSHPTATLHPGGDVAIAWEDNRLGPGTTDIYSERITPNGKPLWRPGSGIPVCTIPGVQSDPSIVPYGEDKVLLAWQDISGSQAEIYADLVNVVGESEWGRDGKWLASLSAGSQKLQLKRSSDEDVLLFLTRRGGPTYSTFIIRQGNVVPKNPTPALVFESSDEDLHVFDLADGWLAVRGGQLQRTVLKGEEVFSSQPLFWIKDFPGMQNVQAIQLSSGDVQTCWEQVERVDTDIYGYRGRVE